MTNIVVRPNILKTSEKLSKSFLGALNGSGKRRDAEKRGSSKLHPVFTPKKVFTHEKKILNISI